ncbi:MAG: hypothetical protein AYL32_014160 [Candidatus Bathyarchaeota archaeon B26-2]|nr:MAG: hypothetical protein AYL32_014160 [Candidatus Bathyarchaeota archaeon B26-2]
MLSQNHISLNDCVIRKVLYGLKVGVDCALCLFQRGYAEILEATEDVSLRLEALEALFRLLAENFKPTAVPAEVGTMRERLIKKVTQNPDPYAEKKRVSNEVALKVLPSAERLISEASSTEDRFRRACLCAIVGNVIEFDIPGHNPNLEEVGSLIRRAEEELAIDDIPKAYRMARDSSMVLYLTDNAGEIVLDTLLVRELKSLGPRVIVAVKGEPVYNDATMEDALYVGMDRVADAVITTGTDAIGLSLKECSREFLRLYETADLVVAKGMGYAETITEFEVRRPHLLLLRTKCMNVAKYFGVERHRNVARVLLPRKGS